MRAYTYYLGVRPVGRTPSACTLAHNLLPFGVRGCCCTGLCYLGLLEQIGDHRRPAGLVAGPDSRPDISVKVLMEGDVIAPVLVVLEGHVAAKHRPSTLLITQKNARQAAREVISDLPK